MNLKGLTFVKNNIWILKGYESIWGTFNNYLFLLTPFFMNTLPYHLWMPLTLKYILQVDLDTLTCFQSSNKCVV